jgi:hypothetical protein
MVAVDSRAARSQGLALAGLTIAAAVSGSRRYRNIRIDGRFSAYGMPNARSALHMTFCAQFYAVMTSVSCAMSLRGTRWFGVFGPAREIFSTGLRTSVETALAPAREGYGDAPGPTIWPIVQRVSVSREANKATVRVSCRSASRTRLTKDASGVSDLHPQRPSSARYIFL